jgi:hypothetical protein
MILFYFTSGEGNTMTKKTASSAEAPSAAESLEPAAPPVDGGVEKGTVADTRRSPMAPLANLYKPPATYRELDGDTIRGLSKISDSQKAELQLAAQQAISQQSTMQARFGEIAPDTSALSGLWQRYQDAEAARQTALAQVAYFGDIAAVALHDVLQILYLVDETVRAPAGRNTQIASDFSAVLRISDQRSQAIREGRARARAEKKQSGGDGSPAEPPKNDESK